jgi:hypothetical protein
LATSASRPPPSRPTAWLRIRRLRALLEKLTGSCGVRTDFLNARQHALGRKRLGHLLEHALDAGHPARSQPRSQCPDSEQAEADEGRSDYQPSRLTTAREG